MSMTDGAANKAHDHHLRNKKTLPINLKISRDETAFPSQIKVFLSGQRRRSFIKRVGRLYICRNVLDIFHYIAIFPREQTAQQIHAVRAKSVIRQVYQTLLPASEVYESAASALIFPATRSR